MSTLGLQEKTNITTKGRFTRPILSAGAVADKNGDAFTRQTCDLNKYTCGELSCVGGEFRVQRQYVSGCRSGSFYGADRSQLNLFGTLGLGLGLGLGLWFVNKNYESKLV